MPEHVIEMPRMPAIWDDSTFTTSKDAVLHALACWAVRQSPYMVPDNLGEALLEFDAAFDIETKWPGSGQMERDFETNCQSLGSLVLAAFGKCPLIEAWNEAKKGSTDVVFLSRCGQPHPDHDFIGLDALARNVAHLVTLTEKWDQAHDDMREEGGDDARAAD